MKKLFLVSFAALQLLWLASAVSASARPYRIGEQWFFGMKAGAMSFFGDLSTYDFNPAGKFRHESDFGLGLEAGKSISRLFDVHLNFSRGRMKGANPGMNMYFINSFNELSVATSVQLTELLRPRSGSAFFVTADIALGIIQFRSIKSSISDHSFLSSVGYTPGGERSGKAGTSFIVPTGIGAGYHIDDNWTISAEILYRFQNTDLLDSHIGNTGIDDRYTFTALGLTYYIRPVADRGRRGTECPNW